MKHRSSVVFLLLTMTLPALTIGMSMTVKTGAVKSDSLNDPTREPTIQENSQATDPRDAEVGRYRFSVRLEKTHFTPGELILLNISLRNRSRKVLSIVESSIVKDYKIIVRNDKGEDLQFSDWGKKLLEASSELRNVIVDINPGREFNQSVELSKLYDLTPGTYTVKVRRLVLTQAKTKYMEIESNSVQLKIVPKGSGSG